MASAEGKIKVSVDINKETKQWMDDTLPGVSRSWLFSELINELRKTHLKPDLWGAIRIAGSKVGKKHVKLVDGGKDVKDPAELIKQLELELNNHAKRDNDNDGKQD